MQSTSAVCMLAACVNIVADEILRCDSFGAQRDIELFYFQYAVCCKQHQEQRTRVPRVNIVPARESEL